jgi:hypothetical protein
MQRVELEILVLLLVERLVCQDLWLAVFSAILNRQTV